MGTTEATTILTRGDIPVGLIATRNAGTTPELFAVHTDHLATTLKITDSTQQIVWQYDREPFGELIAGGNLVKWPLRFPGQYQDDETGLYYNYFRDYDPSIGRYVESDPIGLTAGVNTYAYANGTPVSVMDPAGLAGVGDVVLVTALAGGAFWAGKSVGEDLSRAESCRKKREAEQTAAAQAQMDRNEDAGISGLTSSQKLAPLAENIASGAADYSGPLSDGITTVAGVSGAGAVLRLLLPKSPVTAALVVGGASGVAYGYSQTCECEE